MLIKANQLIRMYKLVKQRADKIATRVQIDVILSDGKFTTVLWYRIWNVSFHSSKICQQLFVFNVCVSQNCVYLPPLSQACARHKKVLPKLEGYCSFAVDLLIINCKLNLSSFRHCGIKSLEKSTPIGYSVESPYKSILSWTAMYVEQLNRHKYHFCLRVPLP